MKYLAVLALLCSSAFAQQTLTIPAQTVPLPATSLPSGWSLTADGGLSLPSITLTGGTIYAPGQYLVSIDASGNLTYTPYVTPTTPPPVIGGSNCTPSNGVILQPSAGPIPAGQSTPSINVANAAATATAHVYVTATFNAAGSPFPTNWEPFARIPFAGSVNVYARFLPYGQPQQFLGGVVNIEVCP